MKPLILISALALPLVAKGPPNDHFTEAISVQDKTSIVVEGSLTDDLDRFRATKEDGEPDHAGHKGQGSVWYKLTPKKSRKISITAESEMDDLILAAYTGQSVDDLTLIHRYQDFASPAFSRKKTEPFTQHARIEFDAQQGITYYLAVDNEGVIPTTFTLRISDSSNPLKPRLELAPEGGDWEFFLATNDKDIPVDPKTLDEDFYHTWMFPDRYDGPAFLKGKAPFGYGEIDSMKLKSNLLGKRGAEPPLQQRFSSYARTTFTPFTDITALGIEGIIDDGAIIYLNGKEVVRVNLATEKDPQDWKTFAKGARINQISTEDIVQYAVIENLSLPANVPVNLCLSLHNNNARSTDMALDIRIFSLANQLAR